MSHTFAALMAGKKARRLKITDFLLRWSGARPRRQTPEEMLNVFRAVARAQELRQESTRVHNR